MNELQLIEPDWPAPNNIKAYVTTRFGGVSQGEHASLNLALHVNDDTEAVLNNRLLLSKALNLPSEPFWMNQVHSSDVIDADDWSDKNCLPNADGCWTHERDRVIAVLTADCLPIFITDRSGGFVMVLHAGWRGLVNGIIQSAIGTAGLSPEKLMAWIGPGIGPGAYAVGEDVRSTFLMTGQAQYFHFRSGKSGQWMADLAGIALWQLEQLNVCWLGGGHWCTHDRPELFFSYRRDGVTGRMASLIWRSQ